jgi:hypothetical protein
LLTGKASLLLNNSVCYFGSLSEEIKVLAHGFRCSTCTTTTTTEGVIIKSIVSLIQLIT